MDMDRILAEVEAAQCERCGLISGCECEAEVEAERVERARAAEALIAKLEQRPVGETDASARADWIRTRVWSSDGWRAFYGDPLVSDEERAGSGVATAPGEVDDPRFTEPEMSGMDLYREHTGHGEAGR